MLLSSRETREITQVGSRTLKHWSDAGFLAQVEGNEGIGTGRSRRYTKGNLFEILFLQALKKSHVPDSKAALIKQHAEACFGRLTIIDSQTVKNPFRGEFDLSGTWQAHLYDGKYFAIMAAQTGVLTKAVCSKNLDDQLVDLGHSVWDSNIENNFHNLIIINISNIIDDLKRRLEAVEVLVYGTA